MGILINMLGGKYEIKAKCSNCNSKIVIRIPRGVTIKEFLEESRGVCNFCGCNTIETLKYPEVLIKEEKNGFAEG